MEFSTFARIAPDTGEAIPVAPNLRIRRFRTPNDAAAALLAIITLIGAAQSQIRIAAYGYTQQGLTDALIAAYKRGVDVEALFDHTQAAGPAEQKELQQLDVARIIHGVNYWIGTSESDGAIRHEKNLIVDGVVVECGSLNYSDSAFHQDNDVEITSEADFASWKLFDWEASKAWIIANESRYNTVTGAVESAATTTTLTVPTA
jgi:phosphatidylserine/phosphatidylglycerophosphate/cardiolipin synthase-like enzyme